jgi:hypothetical protein
MNLYRNNLTIGDIPQLDVVPSFWDGLVSYYKLDGNSNDAHGSNNGSDTSMSYSSGKIGNAGSFNGSSSINCGNDSSLNISDSITIAAWVKTSSPSQGDRRIVDKGKNGTSNGFLFDLHTGARFVIDPVNISTGENLPSNTWTLVTVMYDKPSGTAKIYYNATEKAKITGLSGSLTTSTNSMMIGNSPDASNKGFTGYIDEVGIWSRALTDDEIEQLYNNGNGLTY